MKNEPDIIKELREEEKQGKLYYFKTTQALSEKNNLEDLTELKRKYKFLQEMFDAVQSGISVLDRDLNVIKTNSWIEEKHSDKLPIIGKKCYKVYQNRNSPCPWCPSVKAFETGETEVEEIKVPTTDNSDYWCELTAYPIKDEKGIIINVIEYVKDITEKKIAKESLVKSEEKYRLLNENIPCVVYSALIDEKSSNLFVTGQNLDLTGYSNKEFIDNPDLWNNIIYPEDRDYVWEKIKEHRKNKSKLNVEYRIKTKDGEIKWILDKAKPFLNKKGEIVSITGFMQDITEKKQAREKISEYKERYRSLFEDSHDWVYICDFKGNFIDANDTALKGLGFKRKEIKNLKFKNLLDKHQLIKAHKDTKEILKKGKQSQINEYKIKRKNGETAYVETMASLLYKDGKPYALQGIARDITDKKKIQQAIKESEEQHRLLIENSPDSIITTDLKGNITSCNKAACDILGYDKEELLGNNYSKIAAIDKKELPSYLKFFKSVIRGTLLDPFEIQVKKKDGTNIYVETHINPIKKNKKVTGIQAITRDINDRKIAEQKLRETLNKLKELNKKLECKVKERTQEVEALLNQKDEFIYQLSHDLKNPLTTFSSLIPILEKKADDQKSKEMLDVLKRNAFYMKDLIVKTLQLAKLNSPNTAFNLEKINLLDCLKNVIQNNNQILIENNMNIENKISSELNVKADKLRLEELLINLITNAVKYKNENGKIIINAEPKEDEVLISVADNGIGLTDEQCENIFKKYYKVDQSRSKIESHGLGLSICKKIVEKHGGKIWAESNGQGKGSIFYFTLKKGGTQ